MKKKMTESERFLSSPRIRFNWGYHDAANDKLMRNKPTFTVLSGITLDNILERHFDKNYAKGYLAGWADAEAGLYAGNSEAAWKRSGI